MSKLALSGASLILATALAASPVTLALGSGGGPAFAPSYAHAKDGRDDKAGDHRGRGRDDKGKDDRRGRGRGSDDGPGDDGGGRRGGDDDGARRGGGGASKPGGGVVKVERGGGEIEITWGNGVREELEGVWYERKNAAGRTIVERRATRADRRRMQRIANR